mmetsp:Transcript_93516/g.283965  ORF Transcript_93516/g.283965 Transcript_93516/m.283965 type:complete len:214 (-) Transcript_93516:1057-1698(-)
MYDIPGCMTEEPTVCTTEPAATPRGCVAMSCAGCCCAAVVITGGPIITTDDGAAMDSTMYCCAAVAEVYCPPAEVYCPPANTTEDGTAMGSPVNCCCATVVTGLPERTTDCAAPYSMNDLEATAVCIAGRLTVVTTGASSEMSSSVTTRETSTSWLGTANSRTAVTCALYSPARTASPTPVTTSSLSTKRSYWKPVWMIRCCTLPEAFCVTTS